MGYCFKCGKELPDGAMFCPVCGSAQPITYDGQYVSGQAAPGQNMQGSPVGVQMNNAAGQQAGYGMPQRQQMNEAGNVPYVGAPQYGAGQPVGGAQGGTGQDGVQGNAVPAKQATPRDKYAYIAIAAMAVLSCIDWISDPPFVTILISLGIVGLAIFYLVRNYEWKAVGPVFLAFAGFCIFSALAQSVEYGLFKMPPSEKEMVADAEREMYSSDGNVRESSRTVENVLEADEDEDSYADSSEDNDTFEEEDSDSSSGGSRNSESSSSGSKKTGLDPELKAFLDSYEDFMDEYVNFMKSYSSNPTNAASMMGQYSEIMQKYYDFAEKAEQYDSDEMSKEDAAYYLDTMARIEKKLLEVYY
ncbi:MAG: zinc-ribbon domain-containing protein [Lachnospiraceae bacterium]|nr:zinc-ribbon domain-containing protein [Lachnospiraceae bacterium]